MNMSNNNFWGNLDSFSNVQQQSGGSSQQNDEWTCSTDDWNYIETSSINKNSNAQKFNSISNSELTSSSYAVPDSANGMTQPQVNSNRPTYNFNNSNENGPPTFSDTSNNWFDKSENQIEQMTNVQHAFINQEADGKKCDNIFEADDNFWVDVENREILPPESFQNDSIQGAMNNLQISDEVINYNVSNDVMFSNTENIKRNSTENDDDRPPVGLHRLVTGQTKSFEDYSNLEPCGPQPFDVRTVPGQLSDDDIPTQRLVTGSQIKTRPIDNNSNFQSIDNNSANLKKLPSLEQFQNQFEGHSRQVLHRDVEDFVNQPYDNQSNDDSNRIISDIDSSLSFRNESQPEFKEPLTVIKKSRPRTLDHEVFERTGPDGYMNETSPYLRSTTQNQIKPVVDTQQDNSLKLTTSQSDNIERFQEYDREKRVEKKQPPPPPGFHRMVEGNIGEDVQKSRVPKNIQKNDDRQRRHSIDSDSSIPINNSVSEDGHRSIRRRPPSKKYNKNGERYPNRERRRNRESEEDYFYEEAEENVSLSPEIEPEYRSHRSRNHQTKRYRQRISHENYDHSDIEYPSEYDEFDEYERRRRYRSPESDRFRRPRNYRDRRYQDEMSGQYYRREEVSYRNRPSSRTDSDYHRRYSPVSLLDYSAQIEMLDPQERKNFLLKFREVNPKGYTLWYTNYKAKVEMQKLISRTKNGSECSTPISTQSHDIGSLNIARVEREKEIHRTTPPKYQKYHINAKMSMCFGKLFMLDSSNATIDIFKTIPEVDDVDTAELFRFPSPFVLGKTHKNVVAQYLNKLSEEASNNSERLLYDLICMITKRNGIVDGTDISELLMENVTKFPMDNLAFDKKNSKDIKDMSIEPLNNFKELLLQGNKSDTLESAVLNQNWGLAFTLALFMDTKTLNYVKSKYFQTIPQNDTLQTFFQLSSGKIPSCTTCCTDINWGDWREHLAMILSNQRDNINIARSATIQLGDTLNSKGDVFGAHFCYLAIQIPLESVGLSSKFTLLGTSSNQLFNTMATNRAILLTSAYEFSMRLNLCHFQIPSLLPYKYLLAIRLAEYGECEYALHHLEAIAAQVILSPGSVNLGFIANIIDLSTDLHYKQPSNNNLPGNIDVLDWLEELKCIVSSTGNNYNSVDNIPPSQLINNSQPHQTESTVLPNEHKIISDSSIDYSINYQEPTPSVSLQSVQQLLPPPIDNPYWQPNGVSQSNVNSQSNVVSQSSIISQPNIVSQQTELPPPPQNEYSQYYDPTSMTMPDPTSMIIPGDSSHGHQNEMSSEISTIVPDITLMSESEKTISTEPKFGYFDRQMAELEPKGPTNGENKPPAKKDVDNKRQQKEKNSWLGGLTKFWKPSNNTDTLGGNFVNEESVMQAAPPMDSEIKFNPVANSSPANQNHNQFKIQRKRGVKDAYVNVMSNIKTSENVLTPDSIFQANQTSTNIYNPSL